MGAVDSSLIILISLGSLASSSELPHTSISITLARHYQSQIDTLQHAVVRAVDLIHRPGGITCGRKHRLHSVRPRPLDVKKVLPAAGYKSTRPELPPRSRNSHFANF